MLDFTEEQKLAQQAIRAFCKERIEPKVLAMESGDLSPYPVMKELATAFGIPEMAKARIEKAKSRLSGSGAKDASGGGGGVGALTNILMMELSRTCPGFALAFGASIGLFGSSILGRGTIEQKEKYALPVFAFDKIGAWGLTEPGAGSDAFGSMKTRARADGNGFRITGQKTFIPNAPYADYFVIYAKMDEQSGDGAPAPVRSFIVERADAGVHTGPPMKKMGMHASPTGEIFLDDVFVPEDRVLGGKSAENARSAAKSSLVAERFAMVPMLYGMVDRCLEESLRYAKEREQWGQPIASFQLVQEKIAKIYTATTLMKILLFRQMEAEQTKTELTVEEASAAKLYCARTTTECALEAVQLMGGAGYMTGSVVEMMARDAKLFQIGGGTDEIQILRIAKELLGHA
ncbi:acyl-CoA dehydrogenase family protein [soil metagenome]